VQVDGGNRQLSVLCVQPEGGPWVEHAILVLLFKDGSRSARVGGRLLAVSDWGVESLRDLPWRVFDVESS